MQILHLVFLLAVFSGAKAQGCKACETLQTEIPIMEDNGKSYVRMYTNTTITVNGCKQVMFKCVVVDRSTECDTTASFLNLATLKITKKYNSTYETQDTSYSGDPMICARVPGSSTDVGYFYEGQQVKAACSNRCTSGGGPPAGSWTSKPDPTEEPTTEEPTTKLTSTEPAPTSQAVGRGCRVQRR